MDELEKAVIEATAKAALAPVTKPIGDLIGWAGGDWLESVRNERQARRKRNQDQTIHRAGEILESRGVKPDARVAPEHLEEILAAAQDSNVAELKEVFSRLMAAALDPKKRSRYRNEFVDIVKQMEPLDTLVIQEFGNKSIPRAGWYEVIAQGIGRDSLDILVSGRALERLGLILCDAASKNLRESAVITPMGQVFCRCIED